ncbi:acyl-CoA desaturase [Flammeovirga agarivorans]|uniref:Acyl-CoA desaturase n=1 Tax=Flammeovirga agarivorans TaxID=2726742 RepID=A0A7X8SN70_9BACT|nr:acyl-CoA desaturase [Flammeovirga agarivorans]NLR93250.1 acyl-CoA desaturase [Flammeovirga agarivorans]
MYVIIAFFIIHWYTSLFFQTFFLHRYAAHQMFTMSKGWEKVFFVLTYIFQGSNYLSAYGYGIMHRMHHAFADTEEDPHSPKYSPSLFAMMWTTKNIYTDICKGKVEVDPKFTKNVPEWHSFDKIASSWYSRLGWSFAYIGFYVYCYSTFDLSPWIFLLLPIHFLMAPVHGAIINWFAHIYGYRNFEVSDTSTNFLPFDFLMMGESYHNNHHAHGSRPNFGGIRWHEIDPTYIVIKILDATGVIQLKKKKSSGKEKATEPKKGNVAAAV